MSYIFYSQLKLYAAQFTHYPRIDNTYKAKAFINLTNNISYGGVTFDADHPYLLFCFQFLFPLVVIILFMMYSHWWLIKKRHQDNQDDWAVDPDSWAITIAHAIISSTLIVYILALDIAALKFREYTPEYYNESVVLFHYPGTVLFWDILAVVVIAVLIFIALTMTAKNLNNDAAMNIICCHKVKLPRAKTVIFLLLKLTGVVPLLSLTAHTHYIIIAWITDTLCYWHWNRLCNLLCQPSGHVKAILQKNQTVL